MYQIPICASQQTNRQQAKQSNAFVTINSVKSRQHDLCIPNLDLDHKPSELKISELDITEFPRFVFWTLPALLTFIL